MAFISPDSLSLFFDEFFFSGKSKTTQNRESKPQFGGYAMLAKISYIQQNDPFFFRITRQFFLLFTEQKILAYLKYKQGYDFFPNPLKNVFSTFANIASKETDFFQKWDLYMNDDCYQRKVLRLSYKYLY